MHPVMSTLGRRLFLGSALAAAMLVTSGCGGPPKPAVEKAAGTVTYKGAPVKGATVTFIYNDGTASTGVTDDQGKFKMMTDSVEGARIGKAKVTITKSATVSGLPAAPKPEDMMKMAASQGKDMKDAANAKSEIPAKYGDQTLTPLSAEVTAGSPNEAITFELTD